MQQQLLLLLLLLLEATKRRVFPCLPPLYRECRDSENVSEVYKRVRGCL